MSTQSLKYLRNLVKCHNKLVDSTQHIVKNHCNHVKIDYLKVNNNANITEILDKLNKLSNYISHPEFSYIYSRYSQK